MKIRIIPFIVSCILLAAHFLRMNALVPMMICILMPFLLMIKNQYVMIFLQFLSVISCSIWLMTLLGIIQERSIQGRSPIPSAIILGSVMIFTIWSAYLINPPKNKSG